MLFRARIWPCSFHQDWRWSIWSQPTRFILSLLLLSFGTWFYFSHVVKFHAFLFVLTRMNLFCFRCFFVNFLWWSQTFACDFCCFPVRIRNASFDARQSEHPWWYSWWPNFGLFLRQAWAYQLKFSRRAHMSLWTDNALAMVRFILRVSLTQCDHIWCLAAIY